MRLAYLAGIVACCALMGNAQATVQINSLGTAAPPAQLGLYAVTAFPADPTANGTAVSSAPGPGGHNPSFSPNLTKQTIGMGWATWSNGYVGAVYTCIGCTTATVTLPGKTRAFYLYAEPEAFATYNITVTTDSGATLTKAVAGQAGAAGYGIYTDAGEAIVTVTVDIPGGAGGFAIGEFGIYAGDALFAPIPTLSPWALLLLALLLLGCGAYVQRSRTSG